MSVKKSTYYRPELDALRFFSFFCVFIHHSPDWVASPGASHWKVLTAQTLSLFHAAGGFGMSMFFLLSSFLITELLLREKEKYGDVRLKAFYARRILRIWPLYYLALCLAVLLGHFFVWDYWIPHIKILAFAVFAIAWLGPTVYNPFFVLWSIGVEEQYYLLAPVAAKFGGRKFLQVASCVVIAISFVAMIEFAGGTQLLWYNPLVEFLFFAVGGLISIHFHGREQANRRTTLSRALLFVSGAAFWLIAQAFGHISVTETPPTAFENCLGYSLAAIGTALIFLAFFGAPKRYFPHWILYLGKISYGLYVFHLAVLELTRRALPHFGYEVVWMGAILGTALLLTIGIASLSFKFFEKPFLRIKERHQLVRTR